jgi:Zn-dependent protease with chaperone function
MHIAVYVPLLCSLLFAVAGPRLALHHLAPRTGMWTLTLGAGLASAASTWSLALLAVTLLDDSTAVHTIHAPVNDLVAAVALGLLAAALARLTHSVLTHARTHRRLRRCLPPTTAPIVVLADPVPEAFAMPGAGGRIVVSRGMLTALTGPERRVLFAHERAHLRHHHHRHGAVVSAAAALNPLLIPVRAAGTHLYERCADETAAAEVGDRELAASALARAALATAGVPAQPAGPSPHPARLRYHHIGVAARIVALHRHPTPGRPSLAAALLALAGLAVIADLDATGDLLTLILRTVHIG